MSTSVSLLFGFRIIFLVIRAKNTEGGGVHIITTTARAALSDGTKSEEFLHLP